MSEIIEYSPEYEPWFCFIDNEGFAGFDSPYDMQTPTTHYPETYVKTFLAKEDQIVVGYVALSDKCSFGLDWHERKCLEINGLAVLPPYRRRGIGAALAKKAAEWASSQGYERLYSFVTSDARRDLHDFFRRAGFQLETIQIGLNMPNEPALQMSAGDYAAYLQGAKLPAHSISWLGYVFSLPLQQDPSQLRLV